MNILKDLNMRSDFRQVVCDLINKHSYKRIVEIGVWRGELSKMIIEQCNPEYFMMVDPLLVEYNHFEGYSCTMGEKPKTQAQLNKISEHLEKYDADFKRMTSLEASQLVSEESVDFVFIDGLHTYDAVKEDIELWLPKIKPGGMLSGDDFKGGRYAKIVQMAIDDTIGLDHVSNKLKVWYYFK